MSVIVTIRIPADTAKFREFVQNNGDDLRSIADDGKRRGAQHHRFAVGDGIVLVVDEWDSVEHFQEFFQTPQIAEVMSNAGAQGEPEFTFAEAIETPDQF